MPQGKKSHNYSKLGLKLKLQLQLLQWGMDLEIPLHADECTSSVARISYTRLLVEMDIKGTVPSTIEVQDPNGVDQVIEYEWVPDGCQSTARLAYRLGTNVRIPNHQFHSPK